MTLEQGLVSALLLGVLGFVAVGRLRPETAALTIACALGIGQLAGLGVFAARDTPLEAKRALAGFGQPVVITLFALFIITRCLDEAGATVFVARRVLAMGGGSERRLILLFTVASALLSLIMNNLAAAALLLPSAMDVAKQTKLKPSKLLMPVSYGSLLGGVATYFTTANIIVSDLLPAAHPPQAALRVFDFTPVGGLVALAGIGFIALFGQRLIPDRDPPTPRPRPARSVFVELESSTDLVAREGEVASTPLSRHRALIVTLVTAIAVVASIAGVPVWLAMLAGALVVVLLGYISLASACSTMEWPAILLIAGMYAASQAIVATGLAELVSRPMQVIVSHFGHLGVAAGAFVMSALLSQLMGGQVTALVTGPIAISAAINAHTSPQAAAIACAIGCSTGFLTPLNHPANVLVMGPGGYRFGDFFRLGWGLTFTCFVALLAGVELFWRP